MVPSDAAAGALQAFEALLGKAVAPDSVDHQADFDAGLGPLFQRMDELVGDPPLLEDVALDMDEVPRARDGVELGRRKMRPR